MIAYDEKFISKDPSYDPKDTLIVFDWDDTLLPTTWLERNRLLTLGQRLRPQHMRQLRSIVTVASSIITTAQQLGEVILITNSAPGWVDASCKQFFPSLVGKVSDIPCFAKPMTTTMTTFKADAFKREGRSYKNIISVGDGALEREACLRMRTLETSIKSVKFRDQPSLMQLSVALEVLQERLMDITRFPQDLDLRTTFHNDFSGTGPNRLSASLVHLTRIGDKKMASRNASTALPRLYPGKQSDPLDFNGDHYRENDVFPAKRSAPGLQRRSLTPARRSFEGTSFKSRYGI